MSHSEQGFNTKYCDICKIQYRNSECPLCARVSRFLSWDCEVCRCGGMRKKLGKQFDTIQEEVNKRLGLSKRYSH